MFACVCDQVPTSVSLICIIENSDLMRSSEMRHRTGSTMPRSDTRVNTLASSVPGLRCCEALQIFSDELFSCLIIDDYKLETVVFGYKVSESFFLVAGR